jgi:hypothetical protein
MPTGSYLLPGNTSPNAAPAVAGAAFMLVGPLVLDASGLGARIPLALHFRFCSLVLAELVDLLPLG